MNAVELDLLAHKLMQISDEAMGEDSVLRRLSPSVLATLTDPVASSVSSRVDSWPSAKGALP